MPRNSDTFCQKDTFLFFVAHQKNLLIFLTIRSELIIFLESDD